MSTPAEVYRRYMGAVMLCGLAAARECGLGATDLYALSVLDLEGPMTPGELSKHTGLTTGPTTRLIDRLEQAGYVRRVPDPGDRRKVIVEQVGKPKELDAALEPARQRVAAVIQSYSKDEQKVLLDYFERAAEAFRGA